MAGGQGNANGQALPGGFPNPNLTGPALPGAFVPGRSSTASPMPRQMPYVRDFQDFYAGMPDPNQDYRNALNDVERQRLTDLDNRLSALDGIYQQDRASITNMFNTSEDPNAARIRDWALQELDNQATSAAEAIASSYGTAQQQQAASAEEARAIGNAIAARNAALYEQAAGNVAATNASLAATGAGPLGVAPVTGEAIDTLGLLASAAPREAALAATLGDIAAQRELAFQQSLAGQQAARQGELQRAAMASRSDIVSESARREAERQAREREALRNAEIALLGDYRNQQNSLMDQRSTALTEFDLADAESRRDSNMLDYELDRDVRDAALSFWLDQQAAGASARPIYFDERLRRAYAAADDKEDAGTAIAIIAQAQSLETPQQVSEMLISAWNTNKDAFKAIGVNDLTHLFTFAGIGV